MASKPDRVAFAARARVPRPAVRLRPHGVLNSRSREDASDAVDVLARKTCGMSINATSPRALARSRVSMTDDARRRSRRRAARARVTTRRSRPPMFARARIAKAFATRVANATRVVALASTPSGALDVRARALGGLRFSLDYSKRAARDGNGKTFATRTFASDVKKAEKTLSETLEEEHAHEVEAYEASAIAKGGPPAPFEVHETEGDAEVTLTRKYGKNDGEEITVTFVAQEDPYDDDDFVDEEDYDESDDAEPEAEEDVLDELDEGEESIAISFNVVVGKADGSAYLDFDCLTDGEIIEIRHVGFDAFEENSAVGTTYTGPNFEDLEETVQDKFHDYLEERGINADLASYIVEKHMDKEQREYTSWLKRVAKFVK